MNTISEHNVCVFEQLNKIAYLTSLISCACLLQDAFREQIILVIASHDGETKLPDLSDVSDTANDVNNDLSTIIDSLIEKRDRCTKRLFESVKDKMTIEQQIANVTQSLNKALLLHSKNMRKRTIAGM